MYNINWNNKITKINFMSFMECSNAFNESASILF